MHAIGDASLTSPPPLITHTQRTPHPPSTMAEEDAVMETAEAAETEEVEVEEMGVLDALKEVLKKALVHDGLSRGLHE